MSKILPKQYSTIAEFFSYIGETNFLEERKTRYLEVIKAHPFIRDFLIETFNPSRATYDEVYSLIKDSDLKRMKFYQEITFKQYWEKERHRFQDATRIDPKKKYSKFLGVAEYMNKSDVDFILAAWCGEVHDSTKNKINPLFLQSVDPEIFLGNVQG
mgnify:CR=1 FL=1